jgi:16S rRNA G966 N2-methylase RsmD
VADHSYRRGFPKSGFRDDLAAYQRGTRGKPRHAATRNAENIGSLPTIPGEITDGAVEPPLLPPNTVVYIDPPYANTTGYKHNLGRDRVVELALAWHAAGATVCISEQEAIPELVAAGWGSVDITGKRQGQKRTFSKQNSEYLTVSPTPLEHEKVAPND